MLVTMSTKTFTFEGTSIRYQDDDVLQLSTTDFFKALNIPKPNDLKPYESEWITLPRAKQYAASNNEMMKKLSNQFMVIPDVYRDGQEI